MRQDCPPLDVKPVFPSFKEISIITFIFIIIVVIVICFPGTCLTLSWQRLLSYRNQSIDLLRKSKDWFLYYNGLRHERVKYILVTKNTIQGTIKTK